MRGPNTRLTKCGTTSPTKPIAPARDTDTAVASETAPITAIIVGEFIITIIFNGIVALGAPTTIQNVVTGGALRAIVTLTARGAKGSVVK